MSASKPNETIPAHKLNVLVEEIWLQAALAVAHYDNALEMINDEELRQSRLVWAHLSAFFMHTGLISKIFWSPSNSGFAKKRSEAVRMALALDPGSPILDRSARNDVEHFDERLDLWVQHEGGSLLELVIDKREGFEYLVKPRSMSGTKAFIRRVLIRSDLVFVSQGKSGIQETPLIPLAQEVKSIHDRAKAFLSGDSSVHRVFPGQLPIR